MENDRNEFRKALEENERQCKEQEAQFEWEMNELDIQLNKELEENEKKYNQIEEHSLVIHNQNQTIKSLQIEKATIEAKYYEKVKASDVKKKNLAQYHQKKKDTRTFKEKVEDIVGEGDKWVDHSSSESTSHKMGKPIGNPGGGRKRPEKIHSTKDLVPNI